MYIHAVDHRTLVSKSEAATTVRSKTVSWFTRYLLITHRINNLFDNSFDGYKIGKVRDISFQINFDLDS